ncbi:MAG TPA: methyltransferase domain-containing protein [Nocardioides sp.]|uniref:methyltransferase domain-containing protein n=1 Tax=Nocardioides sp. TaxID=35761 RepID=UPI002F419116
MVVITSDQRDVIFDAVQAMYTSVARDPSKGYHFPTGRLATEYVGYPAELLDRLPAAAVESFAGVGYPFAADVIAAGDTVLDIGSGSGTDLLLAALAVGPSGRALGLDMTEAMREKALANARAAGMPNVEVLAGNAEHFPLPDQSVDVVTSNGVINLVPDKRAVITEIYRVLRPGGRVQIADIVVNDLPSAACRAKPQLWAECIVGATTQADYLHMFIDVGFVHVEHLGDLDYFAASSSASTRSTADGFGAHSMVMRAHKPE